MICINNLTKIYKRRVSKKQGKFELITAVDDLNLKVNQGEILGLIGPNGAGKTTTLKILSTVIIPDSGTVVIDGYDVVKDAHMVKQRIGLLAGEFSRSLYWRLSGRKNLEFFAKMKGIDKFKERIDTLIDLFNLGECQNELVMKYSTGMKHKLALAIGLLSNPPVLLLDEPLTGIDPVTTYEIKKIIKHEFQEKTIIWASHNLYEIEEMCDRVSLINMGKIVLDGEPEKLKEAYWDHKKIRIDSDNPRAFESIPSVEIKENIVEIKTKDVKKTLSEIIEIAKNLNVDIKEIKTASPSLEDIFMEKVRHV